MDMRDIPGLTQRLNALDAAFVKLAGATPGSSSDDAPIGTSDGREMPSKDDIEGLRSYLQETVMLAVNELSEALKHELVRASDLTERLEAALAKIEALPAPTITDPAHTGGGTESHDAPEQLGDDANKGTESQS